MLRTERQLQRLGGRTHGQQEPAVLHVLAEPPCDPHRGVSIVPIGEDLLLLQFTAVGDDVGGPDNDPIELRLVRPSDGAQMRLERTLPTIAHVADGMAWAWSNDPYPRLLRMSLEVSISPGG